MSRTVTELARKFHPGSQRFWVKQYPKDKEWRRTTLSKHTRERLTEYAKGLAANDLLFPVPQPDGPRRRRPAVLPDPETLGWTQSNLYGRVYRHGTMSAYVSGKRHCQNCRDAYAQYRAPRRAEGKDNPSLPRTIDSDGHIPRDWFRQNIWLPAVEQAGLGFDVRTHDRRHAHASWLLAGGADLQVVKERLGHASITMTERYLHTLPNADQAAVAAIDAIRGRKPA